MDCNKNKKIVNRKRNISVCVRMTEEEKKKFDQQVLKSGLSQSEFFIRSALGKKIIVIGNQAILDRLLFEINRTGVNINQIAKRLNQGNYYRAGEELAIIKKQYEIVVDALLEILERVKSE